MMPMPPSRAMQMAVAASVTVSMADDTIGIASRIPGVSCVRTSTSFGMTSLSAGTKQDVIEGERFPQMTVRQHLGRLAERPPGRQGIAGSRRELISVAPRLVQVATMASACCLASGLTPGSALKLASSALAPGQSPLATSAFISS